MGRAAAVNLGGIETERDCGLDVLLVVRLATAVALIAPAVVACHRQSRIKESANFFTIRGRWQREGVHWLTIPPHLDVLGMSVGNEAGHAGEAAGVDDGVAVGVVEVVVDAVLPTYATNQQQHINRRPPRPAPPGPAKVCAYVPSSMPMVV